MRVLLRNVEVRGRRLDVLVADGVVREIGVAIAQDAAIVIDGHGGALLPGLHDHHLHLMAIAAQRDSVDCSTPEGLRSLNMAPGTGWIRATGYHESVAGDLDRWSIDALIPDRPVRIQHRGGALWMVNSAGLAALGPLTDSPDVERDHSGEPNGRLWRFDARLRERLSPGFPDVARATAELTALGITGVTDATPDLTHAAATHLADALAGRARLTLLGAKSAPEGTALGPFKLLLPDHRLPAYPDLCDSIARLHESARAVAVHCVTRESLVLVLAALENVGTMPGDRIEHAAVVPDSLGNTIARLGLGVVTQPSFLRLRGDDYLRDVDPDDVPFLYPYASLAQAGVPVAASSDAPYGDLDPWRTIVDAVRRESVSGVVLDPAERMSARAVLAGYLSHPERPGGPVRRIAVGGPADLCLLAVPIAEALHSPTREHVRAVLYRGEILTSHDLS